MANPTRGSALSSTVTRPMKTLFVGALRFKGESLTLDRRIANFVEIYGKLRR